MNSFFAIRRNYSRGALKLSADYSFDDVPDPLIMNTVHPTPANFMDLFEFALSGGQPEDMLANNVSWKIFSPRITDVLKKMCRAEEVELMPFPKSSLVSKRIPGYHVLGVKTRIECVDYDRSEILWGEIRPGEKYIVSFRTCVLRKNAELRNANCFLIAEYPSSPIVTNALAEKIAQLQPSGFVFERVEISE